MILITGGLGFIGANLIRRLVNFEDRIVVIDNLSTGSETNMITGVEFVR